MLDPFENWKDKNFAAHYHAEQINGLFLALDRIMQDTSAVNQNDPDAAMIRSLINQLSGMAQILPKVMDDEKSAVHGLIQHYEASNP